MKIPRNNLARAASQVPVDAGVNRRYSLVQTIARFAISLLIVSLPFSTFRFGVNGLTFTNLAIVIVILFGLMFLLSGRVARVSKNTFDLTHLLFLFAAALSILTIQVPDSEYVLLKTCVMMLFYFSLKVLFGHLSEKDIRDTLVQSSKLGVALYSLLFIGALTQPGVLSSILSSGINFYGFTLNLYKGMSSLIGLDRDILGADIRRNTIGGVFALYFGIFFLAQNAWIRSLKTEKSISLEYLLMLLCMLYIVILFSRRAFVMCVVIYMLVGFFSNASKIKVYLSGLIGALIVATIFINLQVDNRFTELSDDVRFDQFRDAWSIFLESPFAGAGYGAQLGVGDLVYVDRYVHNFHLANTFMLGLFGLVFSLAITWLIFSKLASMKNGSNNIHVVLLIIPLASMLVSSAVEGIYEPVSWIVFAFCMREGISNQKRRRGKRRRVSRH